MSDGTLADHEHVVPELRSMADRLAKDGYVRPAYFVYFLVNRTFPGDSTTEAGLALLLQPTLSFVWDVLFFARPMSAMELLGAAIALAAIYLGSRPASKQSQGAG